MLQLEMTQSEYGYSISSLTNGSNKKVCLICDYCNKNYVTSYKLYLKGRIVITKDSCKTCRYDKRRDVSIAKYGVENSAQRPEVRKKISQNCEGFDEKRNKTIQDRYGVSNAMKNKDVQMRQKKTIIEKYGVENISQVREVRERVEQTNLEKFGNKQFLASEEGKKRKLAGVQKKYGVDNVFQSEEIKEKIKQTNMKNFGIGYPIQTQEIKDKIVKTNMKKYGASTPLQNPEIQKRIEQTNLDKYGTKFPTQHEDVKAKTKQTNLDRYGVEAPAQNEDIKNKILDTKINKGLIKVFDNKTIKKWADTLDKPYSTMVAQISQYGFDVAVKIKSRDKNGTAIEQLVQRWLQENNIGYIGQYRVENKIADFFLPEHNIIIETDGLYWHSDLFLKNNYHIDKQKLYESKGFRSFFFREDELNNKFHIITSIINNAIGKTPRKIFARKCEKVLLTREEGKEFFDTNHLMGRGRGVAYGLKMGDELVAAIIIRRIKDTDYDISRFCNTLNTQVVGGYSRLIKHFLNNHDCKMLQTFVDKRYGLGGYLTDFGFKLTNCDASFGWTDMVRTFHRMKFRGNSGYEHRLVKIWDCGQARYALYTN